MRKMWGSYRGDMGELWGRHAAYSSRAARRSLTAASLGLGVSAPG